MPLVPTTIQNGTTVPLETATYISDLIASNPAASDPLAGADDHVRLIKATIKTTFPNITGAMTATQGTLNTLGPWATSGAPLLNHAGTFFDNGAGAASTDGLLNTVAGDIDVQLQGVIAATFQRTAGVNFFKVTGGIQATGEIKGPGITPIGSCVLWFEDVLPTDGLWVWANGQIISNANVVAPVLLARWGSRFGGNGTTTMGLPDLRETVPVGKSTMGGTSARGIIGQFTTTVLNLINGWFGEPVHTLTKPEMPAHFHGAGISDQGHAHSYQYYGTGLRQDGTQASTVQSQLTTGTTATALTGIRVTSANGLDTTDTQGGGGSHNNVQPSTVVNYIIRIG
jgi:microcystin-dependent protein